MHSYVYCSIISNSHDMGRNPVKVKVVQSCLTLYDPMDCSLPGSSVHGNLQARVLVRETIPFSRGSSPPRDQTHDLCFLHWQASSSPLVPLGSLSLWLSGNKPVLSLRYACIFCFRGCKGLKMIK